MLESVNATSMRLSILGSCVTGDPVYQAPEAVTLVSYHARTSLISLNSPPFQLADDALAWPSQFAKRCVLADFRKTVIPSLHQAQPEAIVFDFIDERSDLLRCGDSWVLFSDTLRESGFPGGIPLAFERVARLSPEVAGLWAQACEAVAERLVTLFPSTDLILHRCWWAAEYADGAATRAFEAAELKAVARMNEMLADYYAQFERVIPRLRTVEVAPPRRADARHKFGFTPFHYGCDYASELIRQINCVAGSGRSVPACR